jgi:hypothetical protein
MHCGNSKGQPMASDWTTVKWKLAVMTMVHDGFMVVQERASILSGRLDIN